MTDPARGAHWPHSYNWHEAPAARAPLSEWPSGFDRYFHGGELPGTPAHLGRSALVPSMVEHLRATEQAATNRSATDAGAAPTQTAQAAFAVLPDAPPANAPTGSPFDFVGVLPLAHSGPGETQQAGTFMVQQQDKLPEEWSKPPPEGSADLPPSKPVWPYVVGGLGIAALIGAAIWYASRPSKRKRNPRRARRRSNPGDAADDAPALPNPPRGILYEVRTRTEVDHPERRPADLPQVRPGRLLPGMVESFETRAGALARYAEILDGSDDFSSEYVDKVSIDRLNLATGKRTTLKAPIERTRRNPSHPSKRARRRSNPSRAENRKFREGIVKQTDRARVASLRAAVKAARASKRAELASIREHCKTERERFPQWAAGVREGAKAHVARGRAIVRGVCVTGKQASRRAGDDRIRSVRLELARERRQQAEQAARGRKARARVKRKERKSESDAEVAFELPPDLARVWERVKHGIRPSGSRSRLEVFQEWVQDNSDEAARIAAETADEDADAWLEEQLRAEGWR